MIFGLSMRLSLFSPPASPTKGVRVTSPACVIVNNMAKLVDWPITVRPFLPKLLPGLLKAIATLRQVGEVPEGDGSDLPPIKIADAGALGQSLFSLAYGVKILLNTAVLRLKRRHRYGLCGKNGTSKSTLMRAITNGQVEGFPSPDEVRTFYVEHNIDQLSSSREALLLLLHPTPPHAPPSAGHVDTDPAPAGSKEDTTVLEFILVDKRILATKEDPPVPLRRLLTHIPPCAFVMAPSNVPSSPRSKLPHYREPLEDTDNGLYVHGNGDVYKDAGADWDRGPSFALAVLSANFGLAVGQIDEPAHRRTLKMSPTADTTLRGCLRHNVRTSCPPMPTSRRVESDTNHVYKGCPTRPTPLAPDARRVTRERRAPPMPTSRHIGSATKPRLQRMSPDHYKLCRRNFSETGDFGFGTHRSRRTSYGTDFYVVMPGRSRRQAEAAKGTH
ncbi:hypothetical protein B0H14DRAFT_3506307 [Mycena olivaceomarginata]|nr:hypothetical protein B0H14DRAFT_3506307 [Mycena olivaceomarginata]